MKNLFLVYLFSFLFVNSQAQNINNLLGDKDFRDFVNNELVAIFQTNHKHQTH